uniref:Uncharacterized protein n=1 Tax=Lymantria dispar multicapsid nuclear polyhedrosis virus TaxID=10449 RepID=A0A4P8NQ02_NPVLD|nr:hypothetical protein [Lymantria dispar multiple nucleopolyhedrovirus]QCQ67571.1 hypothetical protein [Lymantria dispar multiple nucleopolyhedrovirus]QCQ67729.1 hypothetical protein [Lymantria dispar multiple nucleopolyhedrovirus]
MHPAVVQAQLIGVRREPLRHSGGLYRQSVLHSRSRAAEHLIKVAIVTRQQIAQQPQIEGALQVGAVAVRRQVGHAVLQQIASVEKALFRLDYRVEGGLDRVQGAELGQQTSQRVAAQPVEGSIAARADDIHQPLLHAAVGDVGPFAANRARFHHVQKHST